MFRRNHDVGHSSDLNRSGVEFVDDIANAYSSSMLLGEDASPDGLAKSLLHGRNGDQVDPIGPFIPGVDAPTNIDYRATYASGKPYAQKVLVQGAPHKINVVLDAPPRTELLEGREKLKWIGNYALAFTAVVGEYLGDTELRIYHPNADRDDGLLYEGEADTAELAFARIDTIDVTRDSIQLEEILNTVARDLDEDHDATIVVSDFMDGFDSDNGKFLWERPFISLANRQEDLMRVIRVSSKSHKLLQDGIVDGLDMASVRDFSESYAEQAELKDKRINQILRLALAKSVTINTDDKRPSKNILSILKGDTS